MSARDQMKLRLDGGNEVEDAFGNGHLYLLIDEPKPLAYLQLWFSGDRSYKRGPDEKYRLVHVISKPAGGEIRGYVMTGDGSLRMVGPNYRGDWPELDAAVLKRTGAKRVEVAL